MMKTINILLIAIVIYFFWNENKKKKLTEKIDYKSEIITMLGEQGPNIIPILGKMSSMEIMYTYQYLKHWKRGTKVPDYLKNEIKKISLKYNIFT